MSYQELVKSTNYFSYNMLISSSFYVLMNSLLLNKVINTDDATLVKDISNISIFIILPFTFAILQFIYTLYLLYKFYYKNINISLPFKSSYSRLLVLSGFPTLFFILYIILQVNNTEYQDKTLKESSTLKNTVITIFVFSIVYLLFSIYLFYKIKDTRNEKSLCSLYTLDINPYVIDFEKTLKQ